MKFFTLNGYVLIKQDVEKVSEVLSAGEVKKGSGVVLYEEDVPEELSVKGCRVYFHLSEATRFSLEGNELLAVKLENLIGYTEPDVPQNLCIKGKRCVE